MTKTERISILKSQLQKSIRRSDVQKAVDTAGELIKLSSYEFVRRLPIIAAEDVGYKYVSDAMHVFHQASWKTTSPEKLMACGLREAWKLAMLPKNKDASWLHDIARIRSEKVGLVPDWATKVTKALNDNNELEASLFAAPALERIKAVKEGDTKSQKNGIIDELYVILSNAAILRGSECIRQIESLHYRSKIGCSWGDLEMMMSAAILAICRYEELSDSVHLAEVVSVSPKVATVSVDWFAIDSHTAVGKEAQAIISNETKMEPLRLAWLQFLFEGALIKPKSVYGIYWDEAMGWLCNARLGKNLSDATAEWNQLKPRMQAEIKAAWLRNSAP